MLRHILIPLDGSPLAEAAVQETRRVLSPEAHITLLTVVPKPGIALYDFEMTSPLTPTYEAKLAESLTRARSYLQGVAAQLEIEGFTVNQLAEFGDDPATTIMHTANDLQVDAIIMSTHGRSGISRWVFGSITGNVLSIATCPVYVIPSRERERTISEEASEINYG
jgi:nucleotide-binding universal stress UspA family protein